MAETQKREPEMDAAGWATLCCSNKEWTEKRQEIISELNKLHGDGFARPYGDFIRLEAQDGRLLGVGAVSPEQYRLGNLLDLGNATGTPVPGDRLINHIGNFARGEQ
jgi:hypothetical protein